MKIVHAVGCTSLTALAAQRCTWLASVAGSMTQVTICIATGPSVGANEPLRLTVMATQPLTKIL